MWRDLLRNALASIGGTLASLVVGLVTMPLVVHHLGPAEFGLWVLATGIVGYVGVLDLGLGPTLVTEAAASLARDDTAGRTRLSETASTVFALYAGLGVVAGLGLLGVGLLAGECFRIPADALPTFRLVLLILGMQTALGLPMSVWNGLLSGVQAFHVLNALGVATTVARGVLTVGLVLAGQGVVALVTASFAVTALGWLLTSVAAHRRIAGLVVRPTRFRRARLQAIGRVSVAMVVWSVAGTVLHQLDRVLIGVVLPVASLTTYEIGARLAVYSRMLLHSWLGVVMPATAALAARGEHRRTRGLYLRGTRYLLATYAGVAAVLIGLGGPVVRVWMGPGYDESARVLALLVLGSLFQSQNLVAHVMLPGLGELSVFTRFMALYPVVTLGCAVTGIVAGGLVGLAAGMTAAVALMETLFLAVVVRPVLGVRVRAVVRQCHVPVARAVAPLGVWIVFVRLGPGVESWPALIATVGVAGALFAIGGWTSVLTSGERRVLGRRLARMRRPAPAIAALRPEASC